MDTPLFRGEILSHTLYNFGSIGRFQGKIEQKKQASQSQRASLVPPSLQVILSIYSLLASLPSLKPYSAEVFFNVLRS